MKTNFDINEIEVAIRDIEYLKELNATEEEIEITKKVLENNYILILAFFNLANISSPQDQSFGPE